MAGCFAAAVEDMKSKEAGKYTQSRTGESTRQVMGAFHSDGASASGESPHPSGLARAVCWSVRRLGKAPLPK